MRGLKIPIALAAFAVVVLLGVAARHVYYQSRVVDPIERIAEAAPGIERVRVAQGVGGRRDVHVAFGPDVRLEEAYPAVEELASTTLGSSFGRVVLEDRRTPALSEAFYRVHFYIQEGISTGRFAAMASAIDRELEGAGVERRRVFIGDRHVFVQLHDGDRYLYEVVPRADNTAQPA